MEDWNNNTSSLNELTWVKETGQLRGHPPLIWGSFLTCLLVELLGITCPYPPPSLVSPSKASPGPIGVSLSTSWTKISRNKSVRSMSNYPTFKLIQNLPSSHYLPSFHPNPDHRHPSWDHWIGLLTAPPRPPSFDSLSPHSSCSSLSCGRHTKSLLYSQPPKDLSHVLQWPVGLTWTGHLLWSPLPHSTQATLVSQCPISGSLPLFSPRLETLLPQISACITHSLSSRLCSHVTGSEGGLFRQQLLKKKKKKPPPHHPKGTFQTLTQLYFSSQHYCHIIIYPKYYISVCLICLLYWNWRDFTVISAVCPVTKNTDWHIVGIQ